MKILRAAGNVSLVLGFTLALFAVYEIEGTAAITHRNQARLAATFDRQLRDSPAMVPVGLRAPRERAAVARIRIPSIGVNVIVVQGITLDDLAMGPGHYPRTTLPGQSGTVAIAGHSSGWTAPFMKLPKLHAGDLIYLDTTYGRFTYRVHRKKQIEASDVWVLNGDPEDAGRYQLALTTCVPIFTSRHRLVVWADQVTPAVA